MNFLETRKIEFFVQQLTKSKIKPIRCNKNVICYVLHNSVPYSSGGYATRAHGLGKALAEHGFKVISLTRPGFPHDTTRQSITGTKDHKIDGVEYIRELVPLRENKSVFSYMRSSIEVFEARFRVVRPEIVIAASFPLSALPAIIAAKKLGIPTIYEIRGLEEMTRLSKDPDYKNQVEYEAKVKLETETANIADHVFTLTDAMKQEFINRGIDEKKITLIPNSCDPETFVPLLKSDTVAKNYSIPSNVPVIGYIGSFVFYEGLEDLVRACGLLKAQGIEFRLLLVGSESSSNVKQGKITRNIKKLAEEHDITDWIILTGRVAHEKVTEYYSMIDICVYPRKPLPVCEMVSPMKPIEALSMGKAVVASDVAAIAEMITDEETGMLFDKGSVASLYEKLKLLCLDKSERERLGVNGRAYVKKQRTWKSAAKRAAFSISRVLEIPSQTRQFPKWWGVIDKSFSDNCEYLYIKDWKLSNEVHELRKIYIQRFGEEAINRRIPMSNWARADICWHLVPRNASTIDVGSGLGEFVNLCAINNKNAQITSVDTRDWDKYFDHSGKIERIYKDIFDLNENDARDYVTCFEVIEHLPTERVEEAVKLLKKIAKKKLFISVPFLEPLPLYKGHFTRFDEAKLNKLFPDASFTVVAKSINSTDKVHAWILAEIDTCM